VQEWINLQLRDRMHDVLSDSRTRQRGYVSSEYLDVLLDEHERGRRDHSTSLWALLMLELWHRQFVDQPRAEPMLVEATVNT
ncbi:MAG TPA: asparagine synthase-related protein, partial [Pyrinomonadaceae bacterium]